MLYWKPLIFYEGKVNAMDAKLLYFFLGRAAVLEGCLYLFPVIYSLMHEDRHWMLFASLAALSIGLGTVLSYHGRGHRNRIGVLEAACLMVFLWAFLALLGSPPFFLTGWLSPLDAFLESTSDVTAVSLALLPHDAPYLLKFWQGCLMWMGSLCFIFILVTLLPLVSGCFGMELSIRQEQAFSPMLGRMFQMARKVVSIYVLLTLLSLILFLLSGLMPWDALQMSMRCISTGGGDFFPGRGNNGVEQAAMFSMLLAGGNLLLYLRAMVQKNPACLYRDSEVRVFLQLVTAAGLAVAFHLYHADRYYGGASLHYSFFHTLSFLSTTGLEATALEYWPDLDLFFLLLLVFIGGCMGSVTGGLKIIRILTLFRIAAAETRRTLHPHMIPNIRISGVSIPTKIVGRILSYFFLYLLVFFLFSVLLSMSGKNLSVAVSMSFACMTGIGHIPSLCHADTFLQLPAVMKLLCCFIMSVGRMEIFAFLLLAQASWDRRQKKW